ncbi:hypothetical protein ONJ87_26800, partial [Salmonella enterica subsp. enterica serovar Anatum]|nr:hypothetical protein [Salmonella enterica subsp. enterica serovar Anatum]
ANALTDAALWCDEPADYYYQEVTFLPVIDDPQKIICVGMNYAAVAPCGSPYNNTPYSLPDAVNLMKNRQPDTASRNGERERILIR